MQSHVARAWIGLSCPTGSLREPSIFLSLEIAFTLVSGIVDRIDDISRTRSREPHFVNAESCGLKRCIYTVAAELLASSGLFFCQDDVARRTKSPLRRGTSRVPSHSLLQLHSLPCYYSSCLPQVSHRQWILEIPAVIAGTFRRGTATPRRGRLFVMRFEFGDLERTSTLIIRSGRAWSLD